MVQNKLRDVCIDMCKEVGAYPEKWTCPNYTDTTDKTPTVVTWSELLGYMDSVALCCIPWRPVLVAPLFNLRIVALITISNLFLSFGIIQKLLLIS